MGQKKGPPAKCTLEFKKRRRVGFSSVDAGVEAKDCIKIKDMALKFLGAYKSCKLCLRLCGDHCNQNCSDSDMSAKFHCSYQRTGSSNSTLRLWGKKMESRPKALSSGEGASSDDSQQVSIVRLSRSLGNNMGEGFCTLFCTSG